MAMRDARPHRWEGDGRTTGLREVDVVHAVGERVPAAHGIGPAPRDRCPCSPGRRRGQNPPMRTLGTVLVASLIAAGLGAAPSGASAPASPAAPGSDARVIAVDSAHPRTVSPNGDGYHDLLRLPVTLSRKAYVDVRL